MLTRLPLPLRFLVLLLALLFFLVCGVHLLGWHHDADLDGLAVAVLVLGALSILFVPRAGCLSLGRVRPGEIHFEVAALACPRLRSPTVLRC